MRNAKHCIKMQFVALKDWDRKRKNTGIQIEIDMRIDVQEKI